ncbi:MAG: site-specific integrase [Bacteroidetes bacterium]|nr:site-specific integrase [Bacteroidota bacterium]
MNRTFSILFHKLESKAQPDNTVPIYMRLTIDGKRAEISTKRYVDPDKWDAKAQKLSGKTDEVKAFNSYLKTLEQQVYDAHQRLMVAGKTITAETLKNNLTGADARPRMLVPIIQQHNDNVKVLIGNGYSRPTWVKYNTTLSHIQDFLIWKYHVSDMDIRTLDIAFISELEFYLRSQKKIDVNTNAKYIKNLKKIIQECVAKNWLDKNPFIGYKLKAKKTEREFLTPAELQTLEEKQPAIERTAQVRDIFIFSCYTGLSYIDVANLTPDNVSIGIDGEKWVFTHRQKTQSASRIPLLPPALAIIERYARHPKALNTGRLLPVPSNQKLNAYLKEIADCCGIKKELTFHMARHTFATTVTLTNGVPMETVKEMLGHAKLQTTQIYGKIVDSKVSHDMQQLRSRYAGKLEVVRSKEASGG